MSNSTSSSTAATNTAPPPLASQIDKYPRIIIQFCTKCKWTNRAIWYAQELFQTFDANAIADISLQPIVDIPGTFQVLVQLGTTVELIYRRKFKKDGADLDPQLAQASFDGFPDAKFLKNLVRDKIHEIESRSGNSGGDACGEDSSGSVAPVGDHLIGKGSLLNDGGVCEPHEKCVECEREE
ncbi:Rdx family protein [Candida parapsilosis]|uniref:Rdx family protein n=1 Tax=Candida parapsilosis TaxID=5480 RepID=A0A8X7NKA5_CANPA|nr:Rdx family protein [Candida parapsilosis]KAF6045172.1 Rdx family protein [Candida parapsilosis]KAF6048683.1 Rdx family protein [Candida parapsilosis]KAF6060684.1 Rdx family protein [Candida parapsilosis]KAI5901039.1 hypothetical protein K4G60_g164 [Candida parapsilosis]